MNLLLKRKTINDLKEIQNTLSYDNEENYRRMINTLIDYDNEAQDKLYLYDSIYELYNFVDDELLTYHIEHIKDSYGYYDLTRLRYFINDTYDDGIYYINAYGNLENVTTDDISYCIDEAIEKLEESIA